ncbi:TPA: hypothetical protein ENS27_03995, partial [bacterium]|nr:hypothetical protein [bacterium]
KLRTEYLNSRGESKKHIEEEFRAIQNSMFKRSLQFGGKDSPTLKISSWDPFSDKVSNWFDPEWMFGIRNDFDIVIANPPFVEARRLDQADVDYFRNRYLTAGNRVNTFAFFLEKGFSLLSRNSILSYIIHRNAIRSNDYNKLRKFILDNSSILNILSFKIGVFENVTGEMTVLITKKNKAKINHEIKVAFFNDTIREEEIKYKSIKQQIFYLLPDYRFNIYLNNKIMDILEKIKKNCCQLGVVSNITQGIIVGDEINLIANSRLKDNFCPVLRGKNISRYKITFENEFVNYHPGTKVLTRGKTPDLFEVPEKILTQHVSSRIVAALDSNQYYYLQTINGIISINSKFQNKFLLALLNSSVINFFYEYTFNMGAEFTTAVAIENLSQLPIKMISKTDQELFILIVDKILSITESNDYLTNPTKQSKVKEYEHQIDEMVYKLYDLTPEEIAIVEGRA